MATWAETMSYTLWTVLLVVLAAAMMNGGLP
jgi:hypothetical protein